MATPAGVVLAGVVGAAVVFGGGAAVVFGGAAAVVAIGPNLYETALYIKPLSFSHAVLK